MQYIYLFGGIISFLISFFAHRYFIQFVVLGVVLFVLYVINKNTREISALKKTINDHNELMKQDIDEIRKTQHHECN